MTNTTSGSYLKTKQWATNYLTNQEEQYNVIIFVKFEQPDKSIIAATYFAVVSDEKEEQPRKLV